MEAHVVSGARRGSDGSIALAVEAQNTDYRVASFTAGVARLAGANAVRFPSPLYCMLNNKANNDLHERFAQNVDVGIMIFEQAWCYPSFAGMDPDPVGRLLEIPSVVAMKQVGLYTLPDVFTMLDRYHDCLAYIDTSDGYTMTVCLGYTLGN